MLEIAGHPLNRLSPGRYRIVPPEHPQLSLRKTLHSFAKQVKASNLCRIQLFAEAGAGLTAKMLWPLKRTSSRTFLFRKPKRRRCSKNPTLIAPAIEQTKANVSKQSPITLFSLPPEVRNMIYSYVFDDDGEITLVSIHDDLQSWVCLPDAPRNELKFFPRRLVQIPEPLKAEALAFAFRNTVFVVSSMQDVLTLYSLIGEIGLRHLKSLVIEWRATADVHRSLADEDEIAMQAFELLSRFQALKHLTLVFNGFAFTLAYARCKHRRIYHDTSTGIKGLQAPVR